MSNDYRKYILSTGAHYISNFGYDENGGTHCGVYGSCAFSQAYPKDEVSATRRKRLFRTRQP